MAINHRAEDTRVRAAEQLFPQYETQSTLMVDQSPPIRASLVRVRVRHGIRVSPPNIPPLQKFAFVTNGFTASATVKISQRSEGVIGNVLHTGT